MDRLKKKLTWWNIIGAVLLTTALLYVPHETYNIILILKKLLDDNLSQILDIKWVLLSKTIETIKIIILLIGSIKILSSKSKPSWIIAAILLPILTQTPIIIAIGIINLIYLAKISKKGEEIKLINIILIITTGALLLANNYIPKFKENKKEGIIFIAPYYWTVLNNSHGEIAKYGTKNGEKIIILSKKIEGGKPQINKEQAITAIKNGFFTLDKDAKILSKESTLQKGWVELSIDHKIKTKSNIIEEKYHQEQLLQITKNRVTQIIIVSYGEKLSTTEELKKDVLNRLIFTN